MIMAYKWHKWESARQCTRKAEPGAIALMNWCVKNRAPARSGGIFNCRTVRGSSAPSIHGEGRALDVMFPVINNTAHAEGQRLFEKLAANASALGLQAIIWNRKIYSARSPRGRNYTGVNPHIDHLHIEMTRDAAKTLTSARINAILGTSPSAPSVRPPANLRTLRFVNPFMRGADVKFAQTKMGGLKADGVFGPNTDKRTKAFQRENNLKVDGIIGPKTWQVIVNA